jgi:hypothetical protein
MNVTAIRPGLIAECGFSSNNPQLWRRPHEMIVSQVYTFTTEGLTVLVARPKPDAFEPNMPPAGWL